MTLKSKFCYREKCGAGGALTFLRFALGILQRVLWITS